MVAIMCFACNIHTYTHKHAHRTPAPTHFVPSHTHTSSTVRQYPLLHGAINNSTTFSSDWTVLLPSMWRCRLQFAPTGEMDGSKWSGKRKLSIQWRAGGARGSARRGFRTRDVYAHQGIMLCWIIQPPTPFDSIWMGLSEREGCADCFRFGKGNDLFRKYST